MADKPFAPDAAAGELLAQAAADAGRILAVHHNRRWDSEWGTAGERRRGHQRAPGLDAARTSAATGTAVALPAVD